MSSRMIDNLIAVRMLYMLVTPFEKTKAYELGIIDADGKILRKASQLTTDDEKDAYNYLTRLVFNVKRLINKLPGGESKLKNFVAAYFLIKESYKKKSTIVNEEELIRLCEQDIILVEEQIQVEKILEEIAANATGAAVSTNEPVIKKKDTKKYKMTVMKRKPVNVSA
jgi:sulfur carrier protein ThiS